MRQVSISLTLILSLLLASNLAWAKHVGRKHPPIKKVTGNRYLDNSAQVADALLSIQKPGSHLWQKAGWWNSANILEAMLDYAKNSGTDYSTLCRKIYFKNHLKFRGGFKNISYDDNEWWALAWIKAYDLYGDKKYLRIAKGILDDLVTTSWDNKCGGGMAWQRIRRYKNAITNELFITLAAKLATREKDPNQKAYYLNWALKDWHWLDSSGMINGNNMVNDGLNDQCANNNGNEWTYNQGVILGGLKELYLITNDTNYLGKAKKLCLASIKKLSDRNGILTEPCYPDCRNHDHLQFKGIYIRYLSELNMVLKDSTIKMYILGNADTTWAKARNEQSLFDTNWQDLYVEWSGSGTGTALDLMNAATQQSRLPQ